MCILHRMILWELAKVFTLSLLGITGILLMAGIVAEASQQGLGPTQIVAIIPLLIPSTLPYTIPATTLFATCVVYGRLAADNEILAIKASGINILKVVWPGVLLGLVMSCVTMGMYYRIIPYSHHLMRTMFLKDVEELMYTVLKRERKIDQPKLPYAIFVNRVEDRKLFNVIFKHRVEKVHDKGPFDMVVAAREAELQVDASDRKQILVHMKQGIMWSSNRDTAIFEDKFWQVPLPDGLDKTGPRRPRDQSWQEMLVRRRELVEYDERTATEILALAARGILQDGPQHLPKHISNLRERAKYIRFDILAIDTEMQMRPALSFGCLCFVLVGCPVGIWLSRSDYLSAFVTCFLPIVFLYYPLMLCGSNFAKEGKFTPVLTVWTANAIMVLIAAGLFRRLLKN
jgi:lipopolysaccharide export system permease protein